VVGGFSLVNAIFVAAGLITGPLLARALGPTDRGALAAIVAPLTATPFIASLGLNVYAAREAARGARLGRVFGTTALMLIAIGVLVGAVSSPLADLFARGRSTVYLYLLVGFVLTPLWLLTYLLLDLSQGLARWRPLASSRLAPPIASVVALTVLFALDKLTLSAAAIVFLATTAASILPLLGIRRLVSNIRFDRRTAKEGLRFGLPAWVASLAALGNVRLDQLVMIRLSSSRELGFYAVAVSLAGFSIILTASVRTAIFPRSARHDALLASRATRVTIAIVIAATAAAAGVTPFLLPALFGRSFDAAVAMTWILLGAGIPMAGTHVLGIVLTAWGHPKSAAGAEIMALAVTIPGLFLLIPLWGGIGAAIVSLAAYTTNFLVQLVATRRIVGGRYADYLIPTRADIAWTAKSLRRLPGLSRFA
jgi:O-antigen/teichoic acid export membrane protein